MRSIFSIGYNNGWVCNHHQVKKPLASGGGKDRNNVAHSLYVYRAGTIFVKVAMSCYFTTVTKDIQSSIETLWQKTQLSSLCQSHGKACFLPLRFQNISEYKVKAVNLSGWRSSGHTVVTAEAELSLGKKFRVPLETAFKHSQ